MGDSGPCWSPRSYQDAGGGVGDGTGVGVGVGVGTGAGATRSGAAWGVTENSADGSVGTGAAAAGPGVAPGSVRSRRGVPNSVPGVGGVTLSCNGTSRTMVCTLAVLRRPS